MTSRRCSRKCVGSPGINNETGNYLDAANVANPALNLYRHERTIVNAGVAYQLRPSLSLSLAPSRAPITHARASLPSQTYHSRNETQYLKVLDAFEENYRRGREKGSSVTCFVNGECVVDVYGGRDAASALRPEELIVALKQVLDEPHNLKPNSTEERQLGEWVVTTCIQAYFEET